MNELLKNNIELKKKLIEAEAEIKALKSLIKTRYYFNDEDYQTLLREERARHILKEPFYNENDFIVFKISQLTGVSVSDIMGRSRNQKVIMARFACYWALFERNKLNLSEVARYFRIHHSTIIHGKKQFEDRAGFKHNPEYQLIKEISCL